MGTKQSLFFARSAFAAAGVDEVVRNYPSQGYRILAKADAEAVPGQAGLTARHYEIVQSQLELVEKREVFKGPRADSRCCA